MECEIGFRIGLMGALLQFLYGTVVMKSWNYFLRATTLDKQLTMEGWMEG